MGVLGLWEILESVGHPIKVEGLEGKVLGVDANIWLYKFIRGFREKDNATNIESHKLGLFNRISKLLFYRIKPVFVFDGPAPVLKRRTLERRQNIRNKTLSKVQDAAMKALANQLKFQYPGADIDHLRITLPELRSNNLVAAEKLGDEDFNLFYLPPEAEKKDGEADSETDSDIEYEYDSAIQNAHKVDVESKDFKALPAEVRYEILHDIKAKRRRIRNVALPDDANSFSNLQLERLKARRGIQEKIEQCEKEICTNYTGELADGKTIQAFRVQSNAAATILYCSNTYDPKALAQAAKSEGEHKTAATSADGESSSSSNSTKNTLKRKRKDEPLATTSSRTKSMPQEASPRNINTTTTTIELSDTEEEEDDADDDDAPARSPSIFSAVSTSSSSQSPLNKGSPGRQQQRAPVLPEMSSTDDETTDEELECVPQPHDGRESLETSKQPNQNEKLPHPSNSTIMISSDEDSDDDFCVVDPNDGSTKQHAKAPQSSTPARLDAQKGPQAARLPSPSPVVAEQPHEKSKERPPQEQANEQANELPKERPGEQVRDQPKEQPIERSKEKAKPAQQELPAGTSEEPVRSSQPVFEAPQISSQLEHVANAQRATNKVTGKIIEDAKELLRLFGIPYMDAAGEAEAQCAKLEELKLTMGTITDDSDIWLFGSQNVYRYFFSDDKYVMQYKMPDIEYHIRMTRENLVCFAMLVGSDYTDGIMNVGPVTALEILSEFPGDGLEPLVKFNGWQRGARADKKLIGDKKRKKLLKYNIPDEFPSRAVYEGYMKPVADTADEKFTWGTPELDELREYARRNFGWDQKKADEKLLPVMKKLSQGIQKTIDTFFFKTQANRNPEMFRSKRVNQALNKIAKRAALDTEVVNLSEEDDDEDDK